MNKIKDLSEKILSYLRSDYQTGLITVDELESWRDGYTFALFDSEVITFGEMRELRNIIDEGNWK